MEKRKALGDVESGSFKDLSNIKTTNEDVNDN